MAFSFDNQEAVSVPNFKREEESDESISGETGVIAEDNESGVQGSEETNEQESTEVTEQTEPGGFFDLFGDPRDEQEVALVSKKDKAAAEAQKKKEQHAKALAEAKKEKVTPKVKEELKVGTDWEIYYARWRGEVPRDEMTLDEVREWLEVDYPELSKDRTQWSYDKEKKQLFPIPTGAKKG